MDDNVVELRNKAVGGLGADVWSCPNWVCRAWLVFCSMSRGRSVLCLTYKTRAMSLFLVDLLSVLSLLKHFLWLVVRISSVGPLLLSYFQIILNCKVAFVEAFMLLWREGAKATPAQLLLLLASGTFLWNSRGDTLITHFTPCGQLVAVRSSFRSWCCR